MGVELVSQYNLRVKLSISVQIHYHDKVSNHQETNEMELV